MSLASVAQQMLLDRFAPACVIIDRKLQVLYVHGAVEDYLTFPAGRADHPGRGHGPGRPAGPAAGGDRQVPRNQPARLGDRPRPARGEVRAVKATVSPLRYPRETDGLLLITFEDYRFSAAKSRRPAAGRARSISWRTN